MKTILIFLAIILGIVFFVAAGVYTVLPAHSLPHYFPGYSAMVARHHYTHAVASVGLGLGCFAYAWFASGKKSSSK